jgi:hypothetical protein
MLYAETSAVGSEIHLKKKLINAFGGHDVEILNVKPGGT